MYPYMIRGEDHYQCREVKQERDRLRKERDRLLVLATKYCPKDHHDWQEILRIAGDI